MKIPGAFAPLARRPARRGLLRCSRLAVLLLLGAVPYTTVSAGYLGGLGEGFAARVYAVAVHEGALYAAGCFDATRTGSTRLGRVARFDPAGWVPLGAPTTFGELRCLASFGGDLIVGGDFSSVGGVTASSIARWDGGQWHPLGAGIVGAVRVAAEFGGQLFVGGDFVTAGAVACHGLARWDGVQWHGMGLGRFTGQVRTLREFQGSLYVGGTQIDVPGVLGPGHALVRWDGATWHSVGGGVEHGETVDVSGLALGVQTPASVLALEEFQGSLIVGGQLRRAYNGAQAVQADGLLRWDGAQFATVGGASLGPTQTGGVPAASGTRSAFGLAVHDGVLLVVGAFQGLYLPGGAYVDGSNLAAWDGVQWFDPDLPGTSADLGYAVVSIPGAAVMGGTSISMAGHQVGRILQWARWVTGNEPAPGLAGWTTAVRGASPNPFNPRTTIGFSLHEAGRSVLAVHDAAGRRVAVLDDGWRAPGLHAVAWDGRDSAGRPVASGVYFVRLDTGAGQASSRVTLVR